MTSISSLFSHLYNNTEALYMATKLHFYIKMSEDSMLSNVKRQNDCFSYARSNSSESAMRRITTTNLCSHYENTPM